MFRWLIASRVIVDDIERPVNVWCEMRIDDTAFQSLPEEMLIAAACEYIEVEKASLNAGRGSGSMKVDTDGYPPELLAQFKDRLAFYRHLEGQRLARPVNYHVRRIDARTPHPPYVLYPGEVDVKIDAEIVEE